MIDTDEVKQLSPEEFHHWMEENKNFNRVEIFK